MEIIIEFAKEEDLSAIAALSKAFEEEQCCNGIVADKENFFATKKVVIAKVEEKLIGYCYGEEEIKQRNTTFFKKGQKSFYLEEIYIDKKYRNKKIGTKLFNFIENYAQKIGCEIIETTAVSKDYQKLLSFYIDKLNFNFWSASLIKKL